jgi:predicted transcriptional regulator
LLGLFTSTYLAHMQEKSTVTVSIRLTPELRNRLQAIADREERTLSQVCMRILRDYVREDEKPKSTQKRKSSAE